MARIFTDGAGLAYDAASAKYLSPNFGETVISGAIAPNAGGVYQPFNFGSALSLEQKADKTLLGNMMDCGECHVGGGAMEYIPKYLADGTTGSPMGPGSNPANRIPLRTAGTTGGILDPLFSAFNWVIDVFGPKGDGKGATYTAIKNDFAQSGVLEVDCLSCHLKDYSWEHRRDAVRARGFDASRAYGAGFGVYSTGSTPSRTVKYDPAKLKFVNGVDATDGYKLASEVAQNIEAVPPSDNCASCHFATVKEKYQVEWKKRGEFWGGSEVHMGIGCMGCHERKDLTATGEIDPLTVGTSGIANTVAANKKLGLCDPAKGGDSAFDSQWNAVDNVGFKSCNDCHSDNAGNGRTYNAPNPDAAHRAKGLLETLVQKQYSSNGQLVPSRSGVATATHMDVLDCTACHTRKLQATVALYNEDGSFRSYSSFPISGGAMVDGTGKDEQGRLAVHDTETVARDMAENLGLYWNKGKLFLANMNSSIFWRDMNGNLDINNDGRGPGLDPLLQTHVARLNEQGGFHALTEEPTITTSLIGDRITYIQNNIKPMLGSASTESPVMKLSMLTVPFKSTHNVSAARDAWGATGCGDCHKPGSGFWNGKIIITPNKDFPYLGSQVASFTRANGTDPTDVHPANVNKAGSRSVAKTVLNTTAGGNLNVDGIVKAETIYETTFKNRDPSWKSTINGVLRPAPGTTGSPFYNAAAAVPGTTSTAGWVVKIEGKSDATGTVTERTFVVTSGTIASIDGLLAHMGAAFTANQPEFTISGIDTNSDGTNDALSIAAKAGYTIRLSNQTDVGPLGLAAQLWIDEPIKGIAAPAAATFAGRTAWVDYLNSIGAAPTAVIATIAGQDATGNPASITVTQGNVTLAASAAGALAADKYSYDWTFSDSATGLSGQSVTRTFDSLGTHVVTLRVKNLLTNEEKADQISVKVTAPAPTTGVAVAAAGISYNSPSAGYAIIPLTITGVTFNKVKVVWGDGNTTIYTTSDANFVLPSHKFWGYPAKKLFTAKVYVYNGTTLAAQNENITVLFP
ncbi:PKD domain-containing protein [Geobacter sp. 60473]|uniref:PKD domain-containing protein n=1 Tax=Geobacter sp. 60473 TaxID=3080755 RepID=UPI002B2E7EFE|nr:PKD domain-containing protein [Geobacter sp. 60473]